MRPIIGLLVVALLGCSDSGGGGGGTDDNVGVALVEIGRAIKAAMDASALGAPQTLTGTCLDGGSVTITGTMTVDNGATRWDGDARASQCTTHAVVVNGTATATVTAGTGSTIISLSTAQFAVNSDSFFASQVQIEVHSPTETCVFAYNVKINGETSSSLNTGTGGCAPEH